MTNFDHQLIANDIKNELENMFIDKKLISINGLYLPYFFIVSNKCEEKNTLKNYPIATINDAIEVIKILKNKGILLIDTILDETQDLFLLLELR